MNTPLDPIAKHERAASYQFVVPYGIETGQVARITPEDAEPGRDYVCWQCGTPVRIRRSKKNFYFAHFNNPHGRCSPDNHAHGVAILQLERFLNEHRGGRHLQFVVPCRGRGCRAIAGVIDPPRSWDSIAVETKVRIDADGRYLRPDLHILEKSSVILGCEIYSTHAVGEAKAAQTPYPWIEVSAHQVARVAEAGALGPRLIPALHGNIGPLLDPRCPACRAVDWPVVPTVKGKPVPYAEEQAAVIRARTKWAKRFGELSPGGRIAVYGHRCDQCGEPKRCFINHGDFDRVEERYRDGDNVWPLVLKRGDAVAVGMLLVTSRAYDGLYGPPLPIGPNGFRMMMIAIDRSGEHCHLAGHSLEEQDFSCETCREREIETRKSAERRRRAEERAAEIEFQRQEDEEEEYEREQQALQRAEQLREGLHRKQEEEIAQAECKRVAKAAAASAWREAVRIPAVALLSTLKLILADWLDEAEQEAAYCARRDEVEEMYLKLAAQMKEMRNVDPAPFYQKLSQLDGSDGCEAILDDAEFLWLEYRNQARLALARLRLGHEYLRPSEIADIRSWVDRLLQEPGWLTNLRKHASDMRHGLDGVASVKALLRRWNSASQGDDNLSDEEFEIVSGLRGWVQSLREWFSRKPWIGVLDDPALRVGLLAPKADLRRLLAKAIALLDQQGEREEQGNYKDSWLGMSQSGLVPTRAAIVAPLRSKCPTVGHLPPVAEGPAVVSALWVGFN